MKLPRLLALQLFTYRAPQQEMVAHDGKTCHRGEGHYGGARHSGQALLLAVLLMLFAALLGATFVTVVAFNLSQTARNESKKSAEAAAQAGVRMANDRLVNSAEGENWRPEMISPPPAPNTPEFNLYYTPFEKAQGWTRQAGPMPTSFTGNEWEWIEQERLAGRPTFVKFPDPRLFTGNSKDTPTYLMQVTPIPAGQPNAGMLRVEIIGRSDDNDAAFYRQVVYKGTSVAGGPLSFPMYVANWNSQKKSLRMTTLTNASIAAATSLTVQDASQFWPGQTVIVSQNQSPTGPRESAVIRNVVGSTLFLRRALANDYPAGAEVRAAGSFMHTLLGGAGFTGSGEELFDPDGRDGSDLTFGTMLGTNAELTGAGFTVPATTNGMYFGGGLVLDGKGAVSLPGNNDLVSVTGPVVEGRPAQAVTVGTGTFPRSSDTTRTGEQLKVRDLPNSEDGVQVIAPPSLAGTDGRYSRYYSLTRDAKREDGSHNGYGPGLYIDNKTDIETVRVRRDVNNDTVFETTDYRTLDNWEMHRLWQRKSFRSRSNVNEVGNVSLASATTSGPYASGDDYHRLSWPRVSGAGDSYAFPNGDNTASLEQRGVRGWISPWEYLPRGTLVELNGNIITVTRDDRSDGVGGIDPNKAWLYDKDGNPLNAAYSENIFRMEIDTTTNTRWVGIGSSRYQYNETGDRFNGVIFAEGNVRVRGTAGTTDITIVSKGNIYVEGNLRRGGTGRVALLAKRNVVVNPTQFVARPEGMQVLDFPRNSPNLIPPVGTPVLVTDASDDTRLAVPDATIFRVGDRIQVGNMSAGSSHVWATVRRVEFTAPAPVPPATARAGNIYLTSSHGAGNSNQVRIARLTNLAVAQQGNQYVQVMPNNNLPFVRQARNDGPVAGRLTWRHGAELRSAFTLQNTSNHEYPNTPSSPSPVTVSFAVKPERTTPANTTVSVTDDEKRFTIVPNPDSDLLDVLGDGTREGDDVETVGNWQANLIDGLAPDGSQRNPHIAVENPSPFHNLLPARRLAATTSPALAAGVESAYDGVIDGPPIRNNLPTTPQGERHSVPLTISVGLSVQADLPTFTTPWPALSAQFGSNFGFDPDGTAVAAADEDRTYVQDTFYGGGLRRENVNLGSAAGVIAFRHDPGYLNANWLDNGTNLPTYYITEPKVEGAAMTNPGLQIRVEATILAEEGSWFVIPTPMNQPETTPELSTRYRRTNYSLEVVGTIAQGYTPTAVDDIDSEVAPDAELDTQGDAIPANDIYVGRGAMAQWIDSNARPTAIETTTSAGRNWLSVTYTPQPIPQGEGQELKLPVSPDWAYVG